MDGSRFATKETHINLGDSQVYEAFRQLYGCSELLKKASIEPVELVTLPDLHPNYASFFPDGLYIRLKSTKNFISNGIKDYGCGMSIVKMEPEEAKRFIEDTAWVRRSLSDRMGGGNHFLEVQQVTDAKPNAPFQRGDYVLLLHTGAGKAGQELQRYEIAEHDFQFTKGKVVLRVFEGTATRGHAVELVKRIHECLHSAEERRKRMLQDLGLANEPIDDINHNKVNVEGDECEFIISANETKGHRVLPLPASFGERTAYIRPTTVMPVLPHGTGRILRRCDAKTKVTEEDVKERLEWIGNRVVTESTSRFLSESHACYRPLEPVLMKLHRDGLVYPLALAKPLVTYKI